MRFFRVVVLTVVLVGIIGDGVMWFMAGSSFYFEQNGKPLPVANVKNEQVDGKLVMSGTVGREGAVNGPVSLKVEAGRKTFFGLRATPSGGFSSKLSAVPCIVTIGTFEHRGTIPRSRDSW